MADAAIAYARDGHEVYFVTVEPAKEFISARGRETLIQLLRKEPSDVRIISTKVSTEFELGTPEYRAYVYQALLVQLPKGTPIILSDDKVVWAAATALYLSYPIVGVLHADEDHYYNLAKKYHLEVDVYTCVSARVSKTVRQRVSEFDPIHIHTIPCGINLPPVTSAQYHGDLIQLVYLGRISDYQKRTGDLVKVCTELTARGVNYHLTIIGNGETKPALELKFKEAGLSQHVSFAGWLSQQQVARRLSESDILVMTSDFEGTPIAMMEALAAGCGMVGTRVSGIEDYEYHPQAPDCLSVFAVGDIADAVNKIIKVAGIPENTRRQAARSLSETEFSMKVCLDRYIAAINGILRESLPQGRVSLSVTDKLYSRALATARQVKLKMKRK